MPFFERPHDQIEYWVPEENPAAQKVIKGLKSSFSSYARALAATATSVVVAVGFLLMERTGPAEIVILSSAIVSAITIGFRRRYNHLLPSMQQLQAQGIIIQRSSAAWRLLDDAYYRQTARSLIELMTALPPKAYEPVIACYLKEKIALTTDEWHSHAEPLDTHRKLGDAAAQAAGRLAEIWRTKRQ